MAGPCNVAPHKASESGGQELRGACCTSPGLGLLMGESLLCCLAGPALGEGRQR